MTTAATSIDPTSVRFTGKPVHDAPIGPGDTLVLMGHTDAVRSALTRFSSDAAALTAPDPAATPRARVAKYVRATTGADARDAQFTALAHACGLRIEAHARTRIRDLDPEQCFALRLAAALAGTGSVLVLDDPFAALPEHARLGARRTVMQVAGKHDLGIVLATTDVMDAALLGGTLTVLEKDQVAQTGPLAEHLSEPRSNLAARWSGVNVFSGLARRGWLSIGHSQVRARTELDGKVFVTIPTDAATVSFDEFDPAFTEGATVFEAVVTAIRENSGLLQLTLSPADTEVGLAMSADWLDFRPAALAAAPEPRTPEAGVLHPGLGASVAEQTARVVVGARVWVEVDTARMHPYSVE